MSERLELLQKVLASSCQRVSDLILAWRVWLTPERMATLAELEQRRFHIAVHLQPLAGGRWAAQITLVDSRGGLQLRDTIEQASVRPMRFWTRGRDEAEAGFVRSPPTRAVLTSPIAMKE